MIYKIVDKKLEDCFGQIYICIDGPFACRDANSWRLVVAKGGMTKRLNRNTNIFGYFVYLTNSCQK